MSLIRTVLGGLLFLVVAALVVWLVYSNDQPGTLRLVGLWEGQGIPRPFDRAAEPTPLVLPLGLWYFAFTMLGIVIGLLLGWFIAGQTRVQARKQGRRAQEIAREAETLRQEVDAAKSEADALKIEKKQLQRQTQTKQELTSDQQS